MDPTDTPVQAEAGQVSIPASAAPIEQDTPLTLAQQADASNAALKAMYEKRQPGYVEQKQEEAASEAKAEETPAVEVEPPKTEPTPEEQAKAAEIEEQSKGRYRLKGKDAVIAAIAKEEGISIDEASDRYRGIARTASAPIPGLGETPQPSSATVELQSQVDALAAEIKAEREGEDYLNPTHFDKVDRLADLKADLKVAKLQEGLDAQSKANTEAAKAQAEAAAADAVIVTERNKSIAALQSEYPSLTVPGSPMAVTSDAVIVEWKDSPDPEIRARLEGPKAPDRVIRETRERVANSLVDAGKFRTIDLAIASLKAAAPVAPVSPPPPVSAPVAPVRRVNPPSGSKSQVTAGQTPTLQEAINVSTDPAEKARLSNLALASRYAEGSPDGGRRRGS